MLGAEKQAGRVVVQQNAFPPPNQRGRERTGKHQLDGSLETLRPGTDRPERRRGPVKRAEAISHLALAHRPRLPLDCWPLVVPHQSASSMPEDIPISRIHLTCPSIRA